MEPDGERTGREDDGHHSTIGRRRAHGHRPQDVIVLALWCMNYEQAFAIVRLDLFQEADIRSEPEVIVTVKKVVWARVVPRTQAYIAYLLGR
jgi:hypothetical protein